MIRGIVERSTQGYHLTDIFKYVYKATTQALFASQVSKSAMNFTSVKRLLRTYSLGPTTHRRAIRSPTKTASYAATFATAAFESQGLVTTPHVECFVAILS